MDDKKKKLIKWICIGLLIIAGIGGLFLLLQVLQVIAVPVIGIVIIIWLFFGDALAENWRVNKQRQVLEEQRLAVENEQRYYEIMRDVVLCALQEMLGINIYEGLLRYDGPYIYGPGACGPIYYYELPFDYLSKMTSLKKKELKQRIERKLSKKYHAQLNTAKDCVAYTIGPGGAYLVLICLDASVLPPLKAKHNS